MSAFESTLRAEVKDIEKRLQISDSRAFAVWFGQVSLRLSVDEALEASSYDGGNDRSTDFFYIDDENERVVIGQWKYYQSSASSPSGAEVAQLLRIPRELQDPQGLRNDGRDDLAEAAEALQDARRQNYSIDLQFIYPGVPNANETRDARRAVRQFNEDNADSGVTAQLVSLEELQRLHDDFTGVKRRIASGQVSFEGEVLQVDRPGVPSYVCTVPGSSLFGLFQQHGDRLFAENIRLFLGTRKGGINEGIAETLASDSERPNFWAYNNGITIVASEVEVDNDGSVLELHDFSIVNGCQTTVSIGRAGVEELEGVAVVARVIVTKDPKLVERVIQFTNSQNSISAWDLSARDRMQRQLRDELLSMEEPWHYALRRGESVDKSLFGPAKERRELPFPASAQFLAAFRGYPVEAYKEKALLFREHRDKVFPPDTTAMDLLWAWAVGNASQGAIWRYKDKLDDDDRAVAILKRGARFFVAATVRQLLEAQNGEEFASLLDAKGLFANRMRDRLDRYANYATLLYVQIMGDLSQNSGEAVTTLIRRSDTALQIQERVKLELEKDRLAPKALEEKLPGLPGRKAKASS